MTFPVSWHRRNRPRGAWHWHVNDMCLPYYLLCRVCTEETGSQSCRRGAHVSATCYYLQWNGSLIHYCASHKNWIRNIRFSIMNRPLSQWNSDFATEVDAPRSSFCEKHNNNALTNLMGEKWPDTIRAPIAVGGRAAQPDRGGGGADVHARCRLIGGPTAWLERAHFLSPLLVIPVTTPLSPAHLSFPSTQGDNFLLSLPTLTPFPPNPVWLPSHTMASGGPARQSPPAWCASSDCTQIAAALDTSETPRGREFAAWTAKRTTGQCLHATTQIGDCLVALHKKTGGGIWHVTIALDAADISMAAATADIPAAHRMAGCGDPLQSRTLRVTVWDKVVYTVIKKNRDWQKTHGERENYCPRHGR